MTVLSPHPDRLFSADPGERRIARRLYAEAADAPIISPHGHVDAEMLLANEPFPDPSALLITPDHYVTRLLHSLGIRSMNWGSAAQELPLAALSGDSSQNAGTTSSVLPCAIGSSPS